MTVGIELIWRYMLEKLEKEITLTEKNWIDACIDSAEKSIDWSDTVEAVASKCNFDFNTRERLFSDSTGTKAIEKGLQLILSVYERFKNRDDVNQYYMSLGAPVSMNDVIQTIDLYSEKSFKELVAFVMRNWTLHQHINSGERCSFARLVYDWCKLVYFG